MTVYGFVLQNIIKVYLILKIFYAVNVILIAEVVMAHYLTTVLLVQTIDLLFIMVNVFKTVQKAHLKAGIKVLFNVFHVTKLVKAVILQANGDAKVV